MPQEAPGIRMPRSPRPRTHAPFLLLILLALGGCTADFGRGSFSSAPTPHFPRPGNAHTIVLTPTPIPHTEHLPTLAATPTDPPD